MPAGSAQPAPLTAQQALQREFLPLRSRLLDIAAALDRIDRAEGEPIDRVAMGQVRRALETLLEAEAGRAERVQLIFSRPFDADWRARFGLTGATQGGG